MYHYGWIKQGKVLLDKFRYQAARHHGEDLPPHEVVRLSGETFEFPDYEIMKQFRGTHPGVMQQRVDRATRLKPRPAILPQVIKSCRFVQMWWEWRYEKSTRP